MMDVCAFAKRSRPFFLAVSLTLSVAVSSAAGAQGLSGCRLPDVKQEANCGVVELPENPGNANGRRLTIAVAVLPATGGQALKDPIAVLMGGPGEDSIAAAAYAAERFERLRDERDILLVDSRGTGQSGALACRLFNERDPAASLRDLFPVETVRECARQASAGTDLTQYTFAQIAHDLEQVRRALGYGPLNISAGSYGTRYAQVYMRAFPRSVRTAYLGSVVPIDIPSPLPFAKTTDNILKKVFNACAADPDCSEAFPNLSYEFRQVVKRLDLGGAQASVRGGGAASVFLNRGRVAEWFRSRLYRPSSTAILPWLIHQAYIGNWNPIAEGILSDARNADSALNFGLFFSITCNEDVAFLREAAIVRETKNTFLGDYRIRQQQAACKDWPKASLPVDYRIPVRTSIPTMFVSGDADGGTPLWYTDHVAKGFSQRVQIVSGGQGHTEWNDCVAKLYEQFVRSGTTNGLRASQCPPTPLPPFRTR